LAMTLSGGDESNKFHDDFRLVRPANVVGTIPALQHLSAPVGALPGCAPLLGELRTADILVPQTSLHLPTILERLQSLPQTLTVFSLKFTDKTFMQLERLDWGSDVTISLPALEILHIEGFHGYCTTTLLESIDAPNLRRLVAEPSTTIRRTQGNINIANFVSELADRQAEESFLEIIHYQCPGLTSLRYAPYSTICIPLLQKLSCKVEKYVRRPELVFISEWLLPNIEALEIKCDELTPDLVKELGDVAQARLDSPEVADLQSITISIYKEARSVEWGGPVRVWKECYLNALRLLVPEVKIVNHITPLVLDFKRMGF